MDMETFKTYQEQEEKYIFPHFYHSDAMKLGNYIAQIAIERKHAVAISIEINGNEIYRYVNDGATENNLFWIRKKRNVVKRFQMSSGALAAKLEERGRTFGESYGDVSDYAVTPGAFPIRMQGAGVIGSIGVSGLDSDSDHALILQGLDYLLKEEDETC
jgi:uncharacterized protein (UPF0303 family)